MHDRVEINECQNFSTLFFNPFMPIKARVIESLYGPVSGTCENIQREINPLKFFLPLRSFYLFNF